MNKVNNININTVFKPGSEDFEKIISVFEKMYGLYTHHLYIKTVMYRNKDFNDKGNPFIITLNDEEWLITEFKVDWNESMVHFIPNNQRTKLPLYPMSPRKHSGVGINLWIIPTKLVRHSEVLNTFKHGLNFKGDLKLEDFREKARKMFGDVAITYRYMNHTLDMDNLVHDLNLGVRSNHPDPDITLTINTESSKVIYRNDKPVELAVTLSGVLVGKEYLQDFFSFKPVVGVEEAFTCINEVSTSEKKSKPFSK